MELALELPSSVIMGCGIEMPKYDQILFQVIDLSRITS
jgi:hypothetical protein